MFRMVAAAIMVGLLASPKIAVAAHSSYDCVHAGHTNIGWSSREGRYTAEAVPKVTRPSIVKLSELHTDQPSLTGQSVARLQKLADDGTATWFAERAPAGTIILWTFIEERKDFGPPSAVLVSTKTYNLMGPVSFTDLYACRPNAPGGGR